ncbi:hypothetical protein SHKM778_12540 [Streptomyces sp. KM77-8]|uniref:Uncharacterized protein n=1 Tax=Streptomyces haneummycinicus TaxID=3074435 RepID=A0AAT9HBU5_9ACTN
MSQANQTARTIGQPDAGPVENSPHPGGAGPASGVRTVRGLPSGPMSDRHISQHFETLAIHAGNTADP